MKLKDAAVKQLGILQGVARLSIGKAWAWTVEKRLASRAGLQRAKTAWSGGS